MILQDVKLIGLHSGCVGCLILKLILKPIVMLASWIEAKLATKPELK
jgi:hypothetical protein